MSRPKKESVEFRFYEIPQSEPVLALLGESWVRVYGHEDTTLHFHNLLELGYCRRGEGVLTLDDEECRYHTSMLSVIPANYPHLTVSDGEEKNYWEYLYFDPQPVLEEMYPDNPAQQKELLSVINRGALLVNESEYPTLAGMVKNIMEEMRMHKPYYRELVASMLHALCIELLRTHNVHEKSTWGATAHSYSSQITPALDYIMENYAKPMKAANLAEVCEMSETHFRRLFEESINMTPMDYVNLIRIQKACDMLRKTDYSMDEVAIRCGFPTVSTFNRNFKKFLDSSPYQWKINPENYERKLQKFQISALRGW